MYKNLTTQNLDIFLVQTTTIPRKATSYFRVGKYRSIFEHFMSNALAILLSFATALSVVGCDVSPTNTATPLSDNNQPQTQTESYTDTQFQTEAEVIATDGLLFAQSYDLPAPIAIKRFMFEHHQDFFEPKEQLLTHYQDRLISHGFATDTTDGGHYQIILRQATSPKIPKLSEKANPPKSQHTATLMLTFWRLPPNY